MKKSHKIIVGMVTFAVVGTGFAAEHISHIRNKPVVIPENFTITAHTGCEGTADNSLEAIQKGYESGADIVEFDVNFTADGEPVLAHDNAENDSVKLKDAFELVAKCEGLRVNVDCKATDNLRAIAETAQACGILDRIFYTGIEEKDVEAVRMQTPDIVYYLNADIIKSKKNDEDYIRSLVKLTKDSGAAGLNINFGGVSKKMTDIFREEGLEVSVWTVNKQFDMHKVLALGCDNITTRQPNKLKEIINSK